MKYIAQIEDNTYEIEITPDGAIFLDGAPVKANLVQIDPLGLYSLLLDQHSCEVVMEEQQRGYRVSLEGRTFDVQVADERHLRMESSRAEVTASDGELPVTAPIPGLVVKILVAEGQVVAQNDPLIILEAMKMENEIRAQRAGVIQDIAVEVGQSVDGNAQMMVLGPIAADEA